MVSEIFPSSPTYFQIQLQNDSFHSYVAGQTIIGRVVVELKDKLKIMALKIELVGKGAVHWEKKHYYVDDNPRRRGSTRTRGIISFTSMSIPEEETYIYQEKYLIGERAESPVTLPPGVNSFPYFFTLSPWLPSSFEGRHCHIRYSLQAKLERALFKDLKSDSLKFDIKGILDLNQYPGIAQPVHVSEHKNRDLFCWKLWSVALILNVDKTGFVPGDTLKFSVKFNNTCSNVKLTPVKAYLIQKVTVQAPRANSAYDHKVLKIKGPVIEAGEIQTWEGRFEIPQVEPSGLGQYPAQVLRFNVQYYLKVSAKNVFTRISRKVGLTIGTIPLRDNTLSSATVGETGVAGILCNSDAILLGRGQQFVPYQDLSELFPPIVINTGTDRGQGNNSNTANLESSAVVSSQTNPEVININSMERTNVNNGNNQDAASGTNDLSRNGINTSLITLTEDAKAPLKRTDTPPPSYEEAIKKPSNRK